MDRRTAVRLAAGALVGTLAGCSDGSTSSATATTTLTPADVPAGTATVEVGPGGALFFAPGTGDPLAVPTGTTVRFVWRTDDHNVVVDSQPAGADWQGTAGGPETLYDAGHVHEHTFDVPGVYHYHCEQHLPAEMVGTLLVGIDAEAWTPSPSPVPEAVRAADAVVRVAPDSRLVFAPERLTVKRGATVAFVWHSDVHNVVVDSQPANADWEGTEGPPDVTYDAGHVHTHTFDVPGRYTYYCTPHEAAGMTGVVVVE